MCTQMRFYVYAATPLRATIPSFTVTTVITGLFDESKIGQVYALAGAWLLR